MKRKIIFIILVIINILFFMHTLNAKAIKTNNDEYKIEEKTTEEPKAGSRESPHSTDSFYKTPPITVNISSIIRRKHIDTADSRMFPEFWKFTSRRNNISASQLKQTSTSLRHISTWLTSLFRKAAKPSILSGWSTISMITGRITCILMISGDLTGSFR